MPVKGTQNRFLSLLTKVVERTATEHPHHVLFVLIALANGNQDTEAEKSKVNAILAMLTRLKSNRELNSLLVSMQDISNATIELAVVDGKTLKLNCEIKPDLLSLVCILIPTP